MPRRRLQPLRGLDVTDHAPAFDAVGTAHDHFGRLDVVVNNAGYGLLGMIEEVGEQQARAQIETDLFGALWVTQAALPYLRDQGSGHIIQVSSIGGITVFPSAGLYNASKWALEGLSQALAQEVAAFGIKLTLIEPDGYETDYFGSSAVRASPLSAYDSVRQCTADQLAPRMASLGKPEATREAILKVVDAREPPLRIFFGDRALATVTADYQSRLGTWREWEPVSIAAQGRAA